MSNFIFFSFPLRISLVALRTPSKTVNPRIPRPPPHRLAVKVQEDAANQREADCRGHQQHERRNEAIFDSPVVDEVCHAELFG